MINPDDISKVELLAKWFKDNEFLPLHHVIKAARLRPYSEPVIKAALMMYYDWF
jgi:hypothetical protein